MLISFLAHSTGSARKASAYLLAATDATGIERAGVDILRGDPEEVADIADGLTFRHRYVSGVIAWAPDDRPTDAQIGAVLDDFETLAFAGMDSGRYCWSAVRHREADGGTHVHILTPRVDLHTGKSFNIARPGWQRDYGPFVRMCNLGHGWTDPESRPRPAAPAPHEMQIRKRAEMEGREVVFDREKLAELVIGEIGRGTVTDRAGVVALLSEVGEVTRQGKNHISVRPEGSARAIRLKGAVYAENFNAGHWPELRRPDPGAGAEKRRDPGGGTPDLAGAAAEARDRFRRRVEHRAGIHLRRYGGLEIP
ncbi:MAG: hypothetical protein OXF74_04310, partial [Rhodobacteraceae bacterium]|nr:hypothetical protein [Paracoccaceae bacterium]